MKKLLAVAIIALFALTSIVPSIVGEDYDPFYATQDIPVTNDEIINNYAN